MTIYRAQNFGVSAVIAHHILHDKKMVCVLTWQELWNVTHTWHSTNPMSIQCYDKWLFRANSEVWLETVLHAMCMKTTVNSSHSTQRPHHLYAHTRHDYILATLSAESDSSLPSPQSCYSKSTKGWWSEMSLNLKQSPSLQWVRW